MKKQIKYIFIFVVLGISLYMISGCKNEISEINKIVIHDSFPVESASHVEIIYSDSGIVKALLKAPHLDRYETKEPYFEMTQGVNVYFFNRQKEITSTLSAEYAKNFERKDILEAKGNVVIVNEEKEELKTEHLIWDRKKKRIETLDFVKITTPTEVLWGDGLISDDKFKQWKILEPKGSFYITEDKSKDSLK